MKKVILIFLIFNLFINFVIAGIEIYNTSNIKQNYIPGEILSGEINLSFNGLNLNSKLTSEYDDSINFIELLNKNYLDYTCSPNDCSNDYHPLTYSTDKSLLSLDLIANDKRYAGFVIEGEDVYITDIYFDIFTNFDDSEIMPLNTLFFEKEDWNYTIPSPVRFQEEKYGDFNISNEFSFIDSNIVKEILYCSPIQINNTGLLRVGALIEGEDNKLIRMNLYKKDNFGSGGLIKTCQYNPNENEYCEMNLLIEKDVYSLCVDTINLATNYFLYSENKSSKRTSYTVRNQEKNIVNKNYGIFAKEAFFNYTTFDKKLNFNSNFRTLANEYLNEKYNSNCTNKCILPIQLNPKIDMNFILSNVVLSYTHNKGASMINEVSELVEVPATYSFSGIVELSPANFIMTKNGRYRLYLDNYKIYDEDLNVSEVPIINYITPLKVPLSNNITIHALGNFNSFSNLTYIWEFDDGFYKNTSVPNLTRSFNDIKNYNLNLTIKTNLDKYSPLYSTQIQALLPSQVFLEEYYNSLLESLNYANNSLNDYISWARIEILKKLKFEEINDNLTIIQRRINLSQTQEERNQIFSEIYEMDVPREIFISGNFSYPIIPEENIINPDIIQKYNNEKVKYNLTSYLNPIKNWQTLNVEGLIDYFDISVLTHNQKINEVMRIYKIKYNNKYMGEYYLIINKGINDLYFFENLGQKEIEGYTVVKLNNSPEKEIDFYVNSFSNLSLFFSPELRNLVPKDAEIEIIDLNETKPLNEVIWYIVGVFIFILFIYTLIQLWYSINYEKSLFPDKIQLYNLVMFIESARKAGLKGGEIKQKLLEQGWSSERINFAIRRSKGKQPLPEIIPIRKIIQKIKLNNFKKKQIKENQNNQQNNINNIY